MIFPKHNQKKPLTKHLDSLIEDIDIDRLYPSQENKPILESLEPKVEERFKWIWSQYNKIYSMENETLVTVLLAYYAGKSIQKQQPTLALISYIAVLNSLAKRAIQKCPGEITCSRCGVLSDFKHNIIGDRAAIESTVSNILELGALPEKQKELKNLIKRVFYDQRSAFVHGAELRHGEFHQGDQFPLSFPTINEPVGDLFIYKNDLISLEWVVRLTLLKWMSKEAKCPIDCNLMGIDETKISLKLLHEVSISLPGRMRWVAMHDN